MGKECKGGGEIQPMSQERRHGGVWVVIELYRGSGPGILPAQLTNGVKEVLLGEQAFLFQHLYQRSHFPHAGNSQFFECDNFFGVELLGHKGE